MTRVLRKALAGMVDCHRRGATLALLFDYDGTLVPIARRPEMAVLSDAARRRLERLARIPSVAVGVLSGRSIDNLKAAVAIDGLYYAGTSGLELDLRGITVVHPESSRAAQFIRTVTDRVLPALDAYPGARLEQKRLGLSVHYREVAPVQIDALQRDVAQALGPLAGMLQVLDGPMAIEMVPDLGWTKSSALLSIIEHVGAKRVLPLCAGDDANDAGALYATQVLGGIAIGIGPRAPATARYRLRSPLMLGGCLDDLVEMLARRTTTPAVGN